LKASILHSGESLAEITSSTDPTPDKYQGWGQMLLKNILPIPGVYDFDLYVADESISYLRRIIYPVIVEDINIALRVTISWIDPVNVYWSAKSLLNDLDLTILSPSGIVYYGNGIRGDEYNPTEKIVVSKPELGKYQVAVTAKYLVGAGLQKYSIVITSGGYVAENERVLVPLAVEDLLWEDIKESCKESDGVLIRFQLEDWLAGKSWSSNQLRLAINDTSTAGEVGSCTFPPAQNDHLADFTRIFQCDVCLKDSSSYMASLTPYLIDNVTEAAQPVRVSSPFCNAYLSVWQQSVPIVLANGECNTCVLSNGNTVLEVLMVANVTDDDVEDYSW
jgi:hypothetical protein